MWFKDSDSLDRLLLWRHPRDSGIIFGIGLVVLIAVRYVSLLSVIGNLALALLTTTLAFRIYKSVLAAVNKSGSSDGHPFKSKKSWIQGEGGTWKPAPKGILESFLDADINFSADNVKGCIDSITDGLNKVLHYLRKVFLIESVVESIKFGIIMYVLIVLGRWLNGLTLLTLCWMYHFTVPKIYSDNQKAIDDALLPAKKKFEELVDKIRTSMPAVFESKDQAKKQE